jgi:uncharacterized protein
MCPPKSHPKQPTPLQIRVGDDVVDGLLDAPETPSLVYVFAHGAGAGMRHTFMNQLTERLVGLGAAVLR